MPPVGLGFIPVRSGSSLQTRVEERTQELLRNVHPGYAGMVRNERGGLTHSISIFGLDGMCRDKLNGHAPTARDLAVIAQGFGALGIFDSAFPGKSVRDPAVDKESEQMRKAGYKEISRFDDYGKEVADFYYSSTGYQRPAGDLGRYYFWSTSSYHFTQFRGAYKWVLDGVTGNFTNYPVPEYNVVNVCPKESVAVVCLMGRD